MRDMATEEPIHCWQTYTILHMFAYAAAIFNHNLCVLFSKLIKGPAQIRVSVSLMNQSLRKFEMSHHLRAVLL